MPRRSSGARLRSTLPALALLLATAAPALAGSLGERAILPNGMVLLVSERRAVPLVTATLYLRAGAILDPAGRPGTANLMAELLTQGAGSRTALQISEAIEFVGGSLAAEAGRELVTVSLSLLSRDLDLGLDLLADVILRPAFDPAEVARKRQEVLAWIQRKREDPGAVAWEAFRQLVYGSHPYGHPVEGTEGAVAALTREELVRFHAAYVRPDRAILAVAGDVSLEELRPKLLGRLGGWQPGGATDVAPPPPAPLTRRTVRTIQREITQANITLGHLGITRDNPDYYPVQVMNYLLGGSFGSYLTTAIREAKGWAYDVGSAFGAGRLAGDFSVSLQTRNEVAGQAIAEALAQIRRIREEEVAPQALEEAQAFLTGSFPLRLDTSAKLVGMLASLEYHGLGLDYVERYPALIRAVTAADVRRVARRYLDPERYALVVVGDLRRTGPLP